MASAPKQFEAQIYKDNALSNSETQPLFLTQVEVNGGDNFSKQFFQKLLNPLVEKSDYTLGGLLAKVDESYSNLQQTEVFKAISPSLHVDYVHALPAKKSYNSGKGIPTKVIFDLKALELSLGKLALGFNNEDNLSVDLGYVNNNFNHNAELVQLGVNYRPYKPFEHLISGLRLESGLKNPAFKFILDLHNAHNNNQTWQQSSSNVTGGLIGVSYINPNNTLSVFNGLALSRRAIYDFDDNAASSVKEFGGDYLKSSIVSRLTYANLKRFGEFPSDGVYLTIENEIFSDQEQKANSGKQNGFVKTAGSANFYKSFFGNAITTNFFQQFGFIYAGGSSNKIHLSDRFYLGGFDSFRGFARNSINENGGRQFYKTGVIIHSTIPSFLHRIPPQESDPLRMYATGIVGNVGENILNESGVISAGAGIRYFNSLVNLDIGYYVSQRLNSETSYGIRDGLQMEISIGGAGSSK